MEQKSVLILGAFGMVGHVAALKLKERYDVVCVSRSERHKESGAFVVMALTDFHALEQYLRTREFDVIINFAALLHKDSENNKAEAVMLNSALPHVLQKHSKNAKVIQISTDAVFANEKDVCRSESDMVCPDSFYGKTKALGELYDENSVTIRSAFWGPSADVNNKSLLNWFLCSKSTVHGYDNHVFDGVSSLVLSDFLTRVIDEDLRGVYHLASSEPVSKLEFLLCAREVFNVPTDIIHASAEIAVNRVLVDTKGALSYKKTMREMLVDVKKWVSEHANLYPHYMPLLSAEKKG